MWVFQNDSFLSVVAHRDKPGYLLVRSRVAGDIERALPGTTVYEDRSADYRYRADVPKDAFKAAMAAAVDRIDYPNFKSSIALPDRSRQRAYHDVWSSVAEVYGAYGEPPKSER